MLLAFCSVLLLKKKCLSLCYLFVFILLCAISFGEGLHVLHLVEEEDVGLVERQDLVGVDEVVPDDLLDALVARLDVGLLTHIYIYI